LSRTGKWTVNRIADRVNSASPRGREVDPIAVWPMESEVNRRLRIASRPYDYPYDGAVDPGRMAVLVIDLQIDFVSSAGYLARRGYDTSAVQAILPTVNAVLAAARDAGCLVVHTRQGYRADLADMTPHEHWRRKRAGLEGTTLLLRNSPGYAIVPEITVAADDIIIDKTTNGAFTHTDLEHVLRAKDITHLIVMGCTTDVCVHSTLREAVDRNFQCLLVEDGCASGDRYAHQAAIHMVTVEDGIFGAVAKADDVIAGLRRAAAGS
jgi:nicotinamidase-related amidase